MPTSGSSVVFFGTIVSAFATAVVSVFCAKSVAQNRSRNITLIIFFIFCNFLSHNVLHFFIFEFFGI